MVVAPPTFSEFADRREVAAVGSNRLEFTSDHPAICKPLRRGAGFLAGRRIFIRLFRLIHRAGPKPGCRLN